ncbi:MAG: hypothetical protein E6Q41_04245 [Cyclobacteriaceae bacterium]|nr:MAG: hypothetical protein E6Q41_04245 [Cyclobacteriaceae bacterium]
MRFGFWFSFVFLASYSAVGQYSNSWVTPGQSYYRIAVAQKGVYRLTHTDLQNAGVPVNAIDPRQLQIFHRGVEQAILVAGQDDAVFNATDYIEFFGRANDGTLDKDLYKPSSLQPHNYYNLYSDTTAYFLTWPLAAIPGKRVESFSEVNVSALPAQTFHTSEQLLINKEQYAGGNLLSDVLRFTHFDEGEGWTGVAIRQNQNIDYVIDQLTQPVPAAGNPQLEILVVGRDQIAHTAQIYVGQTVGSLRLLDTYSFNGFAAAKLTYPLLWSDIDAAGKVTVRLAAPAEANNRLQFSASYVRITFPRNFQITTPIARTFRLAENAGGKSYVEWSGANAATRVWDVTQPENPVTIGTQLTGSTLSAIVDQTQSSRELFVFDQVRPATLKRVSFRLITPSQHNYIIISHKDLMQAAGGYSNPVKAYGGYRASEAGGQYDTLVVTVDQLYNQFNYGETSPRAIYEFMRYMVGEGSPSYLFLIGKGRDVSSGYHRLVNPSASVAKDFVPPAGSPGADITYTAGLDGTTYEPAVPTGRLSATTSLQVAAYLNKIIETETAPLQPWQKNGLHLSGGILPTELIIFREYLDGFKSIAELPQWGGSIATIGKRDPSAVELINISDQVNAGVNLVTFFGHSSSSTIDFDIGFATDPTMGYANPGKYPVFLINGCNAGNFFSNAQAFGEDWMNAQNKGARAFIAHSSFGFTYSLQYYSSLFYQIGFTDSNYVGKGIGDVQKEVARQYMQSAAAIMANITQVQQMVLLGDPAVKLFYFSKPDYEIKPADLSLVSFDGKPVTVASDSFAIRVVRHNLGLAKDSPLKISVTRALNDGSQVHYDSLYTPVFNTDTVFFHIKGLPQGGSVNQFTVTLDADETIDELNEANNVAVLESFIATSTTLNLFPKDFALVGQQQVKLLWQSTNLRSQSRDYEVEVDTVNTFTSQFKISRTVTAAVLAETELTLAASDSTVYYWRTRFKTPQPGESNEWVTSSFSYIENSETGWAQLRPQQVQDNSYLNLIAPSGSVPFSFEETQTQVSVTTFGSENPLPYTEASIKINGSEFNLATQGQPCRNHSFNLVAFNKHTAIPYPALPFNFQDPRTCGREPQVINSFIYSEMETGLGDDLIAFVDAVSPSDSVIMFTIHNASYVAWPVAAKNALAQLGVNPDDIGLLQSGEPIIIFGKKGAPPGSARIVRSSIAPANEQVLSVSGSITGRNSTGTMKSTRIGPALSWKKFKRLAMPVDAGDNFSFSIYGINATGTEIPIADAVPAEYDPSAISASEFPYLRVVFHTQDETNLTPALWKHWLVLYESPAEGLLMYTGADDLQQVQEGEEWSTTFGFKNISEKAFTGLLPVTVEVVNMQTQARETQTFEIEPPIPGATASFTITSPTTGKAGSNTINVAVNPNALPEMYYENNILSLPDYLLVEADQIPPVLHVTVDGRQLRNNDFVSPTPLIVIELVDENTFLYKTDTLGFTLLLGNNCDGAACTFKRIAFSSSEIVWHPATATTPFRIEYRPTLENGRYELSVQGADAKGNLAGSTPYTISFQVDSAPSLQWKGVYPNPSQGRFAFQFVLTGELPTEFQLEIFSSQGTRLQQFGFSDLLQFHVGTNELVWNGTDASGGLLAPGIYYYNLQLSAPFNEIRERGKIVLIR